MIKRLEIDVLKWVYIIELVINLALIRDRKPGDSAGLLTKQSANEEQNKTWEKFSD
jgi:hypothetical protein